MYVNGNNIPMKPGKVKKRKQLETVYHIRGISENM